jgi:hypothetical protein
MLFKDGYFNGELPPQRGNCHQPDRNPEGKHQAAQEGDYLPALIGLCLYSVLPILRNTLVGIEL